MEYKKRAYIINLKFDTSLRKVWFEGEDSPEGEMKFNEAIKGLSKIGDGCKESREFFMKAINQFQEHGFTRIKE